MLKGIKELGRQHYSGNTNAKRSSNESAKDVKKINQSVSQRQSKDQPSVRVTPELLIQKQTNGSVSEQSPRQTHGRVKVKGEDAKKMHECEACGFFCKRPCGRCWTYPDKKRWRGEAWSLDLQRTALRRSGHDRSMRSLMSWFPLREVAIPLNGKAVK